MQNGLVSILTPCYNTGKHIHRLLDSVLSQTYSLIEMIVIDDGSTDNSYDIVCEYISRFSERGFSLSCVKQSNSGQSVAINKGLKLIRGEYLVWPDSDDYYASQYAIEKMVNKLKNSSSEFAMVRTQERLVDEDDLKRELRINGLSANEEESSNLFYDCLFNTSGFYYVPGAYMIKMKALVKTNGLSIYTEKNAGQNWQLLLPILYSYRCLTIKETLYTVLVREASHSRGQYSGYNKNVVRLNSYMRTLLGTLNRMILLPDDEREVLKKRIHVQYIRKLIFLDYKYKEADSIQKRYTQLMSIQKESIVLLDSVLRFFVWTRLFNIGWVNRLSLRFFQKMLARQY